jgi:hypothetical protein
MTGHKKAALLLAAAFGAAFLAGCAGLKPAAVKPWERDIMARPGMQPDSEPTISACDDHIYFSREASKGGRSYAGGGCGCN